MDVVNRVGGECPFASAVVPFAKKSKGMVSDSASCALDRQDFAIFFTSRLDAAGYCQFQVGGHPGWLDWRNICAYHFDAGILLGKITDFYVSGELRREHHAKLKSPRCLFVSCRSWSDNRVACTSVVRTYRYPFQHQVLSVQGVHDDKDCNINRCLVLLIDLTDNLSFSKGVRCSLAVARKSQCMVTSAT